MPQNVTYYASIMLNASMYLLIYYASNYASILGSGLEGGLQVMG